MTDHGLGGRLSISTTVSWLPFLCSRRSGEEFQVQAASRCQVNTHIKLTSHESKRIATWMGFARFPLPWSFRSLLQNNCRGPARPFGLSSKYGLGVSIFFVISRFLITRLLLCEHERYGTVGLRNFYISSSLKSSPFLLRTWDAFGYSVSLAFEPQSG